MAPGSTFCDIGSGVGGISLELAKAHSHLRLTLQDQPHILDKARDVGCLKYIFLGGFFFLITTNTAMES
jgi:hypothetical protein